MSRIVKLSIHTESLFKFLARLRVASNKCRDRVIPANQTVEVGARAELFYFLLSRVNRSKEELLGEKLHTCMSK